MALRLRAACGLPSAAAAAAAAAALTRPGGAPPPGPLTPPVPRDGPAALPLPDTCWPGASPTPAPGPAWLLPIERFGYRMVGSRAPCTTSAATSAAIALHAAATTLVLHNRHVYLPLPQAHATA